MKEGKCGTCLRTGYHAEHGQRRRSRKEQSHMLGSRFEDERKSVSVTTYIELPTRNQDLNLSFSPDFCAVEAAFTSKWTLQFELARVQIQSFSQYYLRAFQG